MSESEPDVEPEEAQSEPTVPVDLEPADEMMYEELTEEFGGDFIHADVREVVKNRVRQLYDNREQVAQEIAQARQQAALAEQ